MNILSVIGKPIDHSLSPFLHFFCAKKIGKEVLSFKCELEEEQLGSFVKLVKTIGDFRGFNVTMPYKASIIPYLDRLSTDARKLGAVNTVVKEEGGLAGYNTDWLAVRERAVCRLRFSGSVLILGAGGAAAAAAYAFNYPEGIAEKVVILNRSTDRAERLKRILPFVEVRSAPPERVDTVVNATPLNILDLVSPDLLKNTKLLIDFNYSSCSPKVVRLCEKHGVNRVGGLELLAAQGVEAAGIFLGRKTSVEEVMDYLRRIQAWKG